MQDNTSFGVPAEGDLTPLQVRDALVTCFEHAHAENLDVPAEDAHGMIVLQIRGAFEKTGGDYDAPTKASIVAVMNELKKFAKNFRDPETIAKHYGSMLKIVERCTE